MLGMTGDQVFELIKGTGLIIGMLTFYWLVLHHID